MAMVSSAHLFYSEVHLQMVHLHRNIGCFLVYWRVNIFYLEIRDPQNSAFDANFESCSLVIVQAKREFRQWARRNNSYSTVPIN